MPTKITALPARSAVVTTDILPVVDAAAGTPATQKATVAQLRSALFPAVLTADVSGVLPVANGGTGITSFGAGVATFLGTPSGANLGSALTSALPASKGGLGADASAFTGVLKFAAGTATAATIVNADVSGTAAIAASKIAGAGSSGEPQYNGGGVISTPGNITMGSGFIGLGAAAASAGSLRLGGTAGVFQHIVWWDGAANRNVVRTFSGAILVGDDTGATQLRGATVSLTQSNGLDGFLVNGTTDIRASLPITGDPAYPSPYAVHGLGTQAMADANQTAAAAVYCFRTIKTTGAITANRTLTIPNGGATDPGGREFTLRNTCTGAFSIVVSTGAGTTVTVANGKTAVLGVDSGGVYRVTADV
jgi:hypothetical protein